MSMGAGKHEEAEKTLGAMFTLSAVILLVYFLKKGRIRLKRKHLGQALPVCGQVVVFGLPACMIQIAAAILQIELNKAVVRFGTGAVSGEAALSAVGIVLRISTVVISICVGIGVGIQPIRVYSDEEYNLLLSGSRDGKGEPENPKVTGPVP